MTKAGIALFDTAIGRCGVAWTARGIAGVQLPEARDAATRSRLLERFPGSPETSPPDRVARAVDDIAALLRGEAPDLSSVQLDMERVPPFHRRVYDAARAIPPGATLSYGELARRLGKPGTARAVGQALGKNPFALVVPCHRVLAAGGRVGGFSANGGVTTKCACWPSKVPAAHLDSSRATARSASTPTPRSSMSGLPIRGWRS